MRWLNKHRTKLIFRLSFDQRLPDGEHKRLRNFVRDTISAGGWMCRDWGKDFYSFRLLHAFTVNDAATQLNAHSSQPPNAALQAAISLSAACAHQPPHR